MNVRELIADLERRNPDDEVVIYDRLQEETLRIRPDEDRWDFEVCFGDNEVVFEITEPGEEERV